MAKQIYDTTYVKLIDGEELYITPLKIRYLREFMEEFKKLKDVKNEDEKLDVLLECIRITMKQYCPELKTREDVEDNIDMDTLYKILEFSAGINITETNKGLPEEKVEIEENSTWDKLDLVELESEIFLLGIWRDYEELESSLCMEELTAILNAKRESDYNEKKFLAAMQGVDLDKESGKQKEADPWEAMKARVFSKGATSDPNDIISFRGSKAQKAGFGIGNGLGYTKLDH